MNAGLRSLVLCLACCMAGPALAPATALAEGSSSALGGTGGSALESPLVVPGSPVEGEQLRAAEEAELASPEAVAQRIAARTRYEQLTAEQVEKVVAESFPVVIDQPAGGPPKLPMGQSITAYLSDNVAQVDLGGGKRGVIDSMAPIAVETSPGERKPVDLALDDVGGAFEPRTPVVGVRIPKRLDDGVRLGSSGVSLTPVDGSGSPLEGSEGRVDGASVLYANTETDADTVIKPTTAGFEADTVLRSVASPEQLYLRVGLPAGASLVQAKDGSGSARVVDGGRVIALVLAPSARDAAGTPVPVSMVVSGDSLRMSVDFRSGEYEMPIEVDPTVVDKAIFSAGLESAGNWTFSTNSEIEEEYLSCESKCTNKEVPGENHGIEITDHVGKVFSEGAYGFLEYPTQGASHIYEFTGYTAEENPASGVRSDLFIEDKANGMEGKEVVLPTRGEGESQVCASEKCAVGTVTSGDEANRVLFDVRITESNLYTFADRLWRSAVGILQEKAPSATFDTADPTIEGHPNSLYGSKWSDSVDDVGIDAFDPGIGIYKESVGLVGKLGRVDSEGPENGCVGVQCNECYEAECPNKAKGKPIPLSLPSGSELPEGEDVIEGKVEDWAGLSGATPHATVKMDYTPPYSLGLSGLPASGELNEQPYHLVGQASDALSGVGSIELELDGRVVGKASGSCTPGPCTAKSEEWTISTEGVGAGKQTLTVVATDNAGNVATQNYTVTVRHSAPVTVGPGSVNPATGQLYLGATDVSVGAPRSPLTVGRSYESRELTAGVEGPLGPQWSLSLGSVEQLLPGTGGRVTLVAANGGQTTFVSSGNGEFEAPKGDSNLSLSDVTEGEVIKEYVLRNTTDDTTTKFSLPSGGSGGPWEPTTAEGPVVSDTRTYAFQTVEVEGKKITEPTQELAPVPGGVSCSPKLERGCRALTFGYATSTTATGEAPSQWGEYNGRLVHVYFTAWEPVKKEMTTSTVAQYAYDKQGRLRAAWDPGVSPALKTTYGYDSEEHVAAESPPGQQPWLFAYGTIPGEGAAGRLLSITRPAASVALGNGEAPSNTALPTLSGSKPVVGSKISVSGNGTWSGGPLAYSYQWEDCNSSGGECAAISGAVNQAYYPAASDEGHTLRAQVRAVNAGGSVTASSAATAMVAAGTPYSPAPEPPSVGSNAVWTFEYEAPVSGSGAPYAMGAKELEGWAQQDDPNEAMAIFPPDEPMGWPAEDYKRATVHYLDVLGRAVNVAAPGGAISTTEYNTTNDVARTLTPDNRAAALKEGSKSPEVAKLLDTKSFYNTSGTELVETLGPQHTIKVTGGSEGLARNVESYYYNEGAPLLGGPYNLVTKTVDGAQVQGQGEEKDMRVTSISYSGQNNLGWQLRKPTAVTTDPTNGLLGAVTSDFGSPGSGNGQFNEPRGVALTANGDVYVADTKNNRVQKFSPSGEYLAQFGGLEGTGKLKEPKGVAVAANGDVYVADTGDGCVKEFGEKGEYLRQFASGTVVAVAVSSENDVFAVVDGAGRVVHEYSETGSLIREFAEEHPALESESVLEPQGIAVHGESVYLTDKTTSKLVQKFTTSGSYSEGFISKGSLIGTLKEPEGITVLADGDLYVADTGNDRVEEFNGTGGYLAQYGSAGAGNGQLEHPGGVALDSSGDMYVVDTGNDRVQKWGGSSTTGLNLVHATIYEPQTGNVMETRSPSAGPVQAEGSYTYTFKAAYGKSGSGNGQFSEPRGVAVAANGDVYVADTKNNRVQELSPSGEYLMQFGSSEGSGKLKEPQGVAVAPNGDVYVADTGGECVKVFGEKGEYIRQFASEDVIGVAVSAQEEIFVLADASKVIQEYSETGSRIREFGEESARSGSEDVVQPQTIAVRNGVVYVTDRTSLTPIQKFSTEGAYIGGVSGLKGSGNDQFKEPEGITVVPDGDIYISEIGNDRVQELTAKGEYAAQYGSKGTGNGQLEHPDDVAFAPNGHMYIADTGNSRIQKWIAPGEHAVPTQEIYYSAALNAAYPACGGRSEWADLLCETRPAEQPEGSLPNLPTKTQTYNVWEEPEKATEVTGSTSRTTMDEYDAAGRLLSSETTSSTGTALPEVSYTYNEKTGAQEKQSAVIEGKTKTITSAYNSLGQLEAYTDADENTATYEYDVDGRIHKMSDGKGTQTYSYEETTGDLTKLVDSGAGTFTASYDTEGNMLTEGYPNGMTATYTYNQVGAATALEYKKTTHCTEKCTWFSDSIVTSIHGQWLEQTSTLSHQAYTYDAAGRLTQVQSTPAGKGCTTRIYTYDEDTNRTSLTTREPNSKGECSGEGGTTEHHTYDEADRLTDTGTTYNAFGDIIALPSADAGGSELTSSYYADNQLQSQTQNGQTIGYNLDPARRTREIVQTGKKTSDVINHYAGPGDSPAWTSNTAGETTRNIPGINGTLAATQSNLEAPVLQLTNLHGDIIATAYLSETATGLASSADTSEFGVPTTSLPPKYSWLGAIELPTELPSGVVAMGARSYVPQLGRFLQPDPQPGGSANAYSYTFGDPVDTTDPSGEYTATVTPGTVEAEIQRAEEAAAEVRRAAEEAAARAEAELKAQEAAFEAGLAGPQYAGGEEEYWEEWEEYGEEEGGYEYVSDHHNGENGKEEAHIEPAVLYPPLGEATDTDGLDEEWLRIFIEYGSRCEQYGGHWQGHKCVGIPSHGHGHVTVRDVGCTIAGAIGGAIGDVPGALVAGGACIAIWP